MKILIDVSHPAHVHFFKNAIHLFVENEHEVKLVSRDKDITIQLLDLSGFNHDVLSIAPKNKNIFNFFCEMMSHCNRLYIKAKKFKPDVMLQIAGTFIAPVGRLVGSPSVVFYDTEFAFLSNSISYPLANCVCTPSCYNKNILFGRHIKYEGYHELAYLHPNYFFPDKKYLLENKLDENEKFFIVRFVNWSALHDYNEKGFSVKCKINLIQMLSCFGKVLISSEGDLPDELLMYKSNVSYEKIHHVMAYATMVIGESATMASEAAVLGVPSVFISTTPRGYTDEQEYRYKIVKNFKPNQQEECLAYVESIVSRKLEDIRSEYNAKRYKILQEKIDVTEWIYNFIIKEKYKS